MTDNQISNNPNFNQRYLEEVIKCKICFNIIEEKDIKNNLAINPCNCQASYAFAHTKCLNERLEMTGHQSCDVCRFEFVMDKHPKSQWIWFRQFIGTEDFIELLVRVINVLHICIIGYIVWRYDIEIIDHINQWFWFQIQWLLICISGFRLFWMIKLCCDLFFKSKQDFIDWKTKNFTIDVKKNPNFKKAKRISHQLSAQLRNCGLFNRKKKNEISLIGI